MILDRVKSVALSLLDLLGMPFTWSSAIWLKNVRRAQNRMPVSRWLLRRVGVVPVRHHYYEPMVIPGDLRRPLTDPRTIRGLDLNLPEQLQILEAFKVDDGVDAVLARLPLEREGADSFYYHNEWFESGDAEFLFHMVRHFKPRNIVEIGGGYSTLMARHAIQKNIDADAAYACHHVCIEPFEQQWLEQTGAVVIRDRVEVADAKLFSALQKNDLLFIDSSHVIRPQGDVLFEYLELLGTLNSGVIVHVHDIFTPRDYPEQWVLNDAKLWNEQYLLEAFLAYNSEFRVIGALNYLWHNSREELARVCPVLAQDPDREPRSFWFVRN